MSASHSSSELRRVGQKEGRPRRRRLMEFLPEIRCPAPSSRPEGEEDGSDGEIELTLGLSPLGCRTRKLSAARLRIPPPAEAPKGAAFSVPDGGVTVEDRAARETRMLESRARERSAREAEENRGGRWWGKDRKGAAAVFALPPYVAQVMYPYQAHQQVPVANGFGVPYLMSCWAPTSMSAAAGACRMDNASQAAAAALGRVPIPVPPISACAGCVAQPLESPGSSSSGVSDHRSTSLLAVNASSSGSSDSIKSPSSHLTGKNAAVAQPRRQLGKCESASAPTPDTAASAGKSRLVSAVAPAMPEKAASPNKPCAAVPDVESKSRSGYGDAGAAAPAGLPSSRMPCVSTTGSGPNGRTVTGFLYKYDKSGVGIVCTCHGKSFSPAEFVRHAGGADVAHPMRHIVMVPSCEC